MAAEPVAGEPSPVHGLPGHLVDFVAALRRAGVRVGPGETVDAAAAAAVLDVLRRDHFREGLAATLLRRSGQRQVFDTLFELYFPAAVGAGQGEVEVPRLGDAPGGGAAEGIAGGAVDLDALREVLAELLRDGDTAALAELARAVVEALGRTGGAGGSGPPGWSAYQALQALAPETLLARILAAMAAESAEEHTPFQAELMRRVIRARLAEFRTMVAAEVRRRSAEVRGREAVARTAVPKQVEQVEFLRANAEQLAALRRTVAPFARRLATRLAVRRRHAKRGEIDLRRTMRRSLATGGVPMRPAARRRRPGRPELVVLCDVSGSVAGFSHFTLLLVQALREQFSRVRVFAFVERTAEVTAYFGPGAQPAGAMRRVLAETDLVATDGHSDYGGSLASFVRRYPDAVTARSSLLVLGDGRTNYRDPALATLAELVGQARHAYWLNPEPSRQWGTGDSAAPRYARLLPMFECRTAEALAGVVEELLVV